MKISELKRYVDDLERAAGGKDIDVDFIFENNGMVKSFKSPFIPLVQFNVNVSVGTFTFTAWGD